MAKIQAEARLGVEISVWSCFLRSLDNGNIEDVLRADVFFSLGKLSDLSHTHVYVVVFREILYSGRTVM